jgi:methyl-accepting chemotaxis protein
MGKVTQQNAAASEESSGAAEELSSQSEELAAMVGSFRIKRGQESVVPRLASQKATPVVLGVPAPSVSKHPVRRSVG